MYSKPEFFQPGSEESSQPKEQAPPPFQIAIDGTVASGKGTVSRNLAEHLGFLYADTGAMYRCVALITARCGFDPADVASISSELLRSEITLLVPDEDHRDGRLVTVLLNGEDVSWQIREPEIGTLSAITSQHVVIRQELVRRQQEMAAQVSVIMEGRDITHTVLPNAQLKIYLDADPWVRANRRCQQLLAQGYQVTVEEVHRDLLERDRRDMENNLRRVPGVWEIDTTQLTSEEVIELILGRFQELTQVR